LLQNLMDNRNKTKFSSHANISSQFHENIIEKKKPIFYNHQYIHARTALAMTDFNKAVIISLDGKGIDDGIPSTGGIFVANKGNIEPIKIYPDQSSLGFVFGCITEICGFRMQDGEGKTMSLAAFGELEPEDEKQRAYQTISKIFPKFEGIDYIGGGIKDPIIKFRHNTTMVSNIDERLAELGKIFKKEIIAWAAQKLLEEIVSELVVKAAEITGIKNVIVTGGLFLNIIMNMKIREKLGKNYQIFFNPICGDLGNALGAAFEQYFSETGENLIFPNFPLCLGPSYNNNEVLYAIKQLNLKFQRVDKVQTAIDMLSSGKIIGWFQGRAELGPRSLGNRSILAPVTDIKFKDLINEKVKKRESWRPFCPTIIDEKKSEYLVDPIEAPYMILGFRMKNSDSVPAICHIDNSCRPQTLLKENNPSFYDVTKGIGGIILNTSLNLAGDPIVNSPTDALLTLKKSEMDGLIINDFLVTR